MIRSLSSLASPLFFALVLPSVFAVGHAAEPTGIWGRQIASQPFDDTPYREIRIPKWVEQTTGCGYTLSVMGSKDRERAARHGVTLSELGFVDPFYAYYDSRLLKRRSPHVPPGKLQQDLAEYQRLGVRVLGVYPPCLQGEVYETHPEWRRIATNVREISQVDLKQHPYGGMLCLLGPYGDFFIDVLAEILEKFPQVDAFSFDGLHYGGVCYCEHCRQGYRAATAQEIPAPDMNDPAFRRYQHWADRRMEDLVRRMQTRLKGIKPDVALVTWTTNAGRFGHFLSIPRNMPARMNLLLDAPDQEFWLDETNRGTTIVPAFANAYIWATTNHRVAFSEPYILSHGNPYGKDSFPPHEIERRMMLALTYGASPSIAALQPPRLQDELYRCLDEVRRRRPWLTDKQPERWAALLMSDNTRNFYGRSAGQVEERYLASVFGAFRATVEEHLPTSVVNDWNLNAPDLDEYRCLILPNAACLDDAQVAAVERYVRDGGGLVASLDTSLFDEYGTPRADFALRDVLGVSYRGLPLGNSASAVSPQAPPVREELDVNFAQAIGPDYWEKRKNVFDFRQDVNSWLNQGRMKTYVGDEPVTFKGPAIRTAIRPSEARDAVRPLGWLRAKGGAAAGEFPAVTARTYGRGRVVYFAAALDAGYYLYAYPYQRLVLRQAIEWAAGERPPIEVRAPMCVHATVMRQTSAAGSRLVVHLFNDVNTTAHHALPVDDVPLREETLPIHDITVRIDRRYDVARVTWAPEGRELAVRRGEAGTEVTAPRLDVHGMVIVELR